MQFVKFGIAFKTESDKVSVTASQNQTLTGKLAVTTVPSMLDIETETLTTPPAVSEPVKNTSLQLKELESTAVLELLQVRPAVAVRIKPDFNNVETVTTFDCLTPFKVAVLLISACML